MFPYTCLFVIDSLGSIDTEAEAVLLEMLLTVDTSFILTAEQTVSPRMSSGVNTLGMCVVRQTLSCVFHALVNTVLCTDVACVSGRREGRVVRLQGGESRCSVCMCISVMMDVAN